MSDLNGPPTWREMYALLDKVQADIDARFAAHEKQHTYDRDHRASLSRWLITTIMTGFGVVVSILIAIFLTHSGRP